MPRRKNPIATFLLFVGVLGFGYGAYYFIEVKKVFESDDKVAPPATEVARLRELVENDLAHDENFDRVSSFNWRESSKRYRVDISITDGASVAQAKALAKRVAEVIKRATDGYEAEIWCLVLGQELWHFIP